MGEKQKMLTAVDLSISILGSLFVALMFTGIHIQFPLHVLTMVWPRLFIKHADLTCNKTTCSIVTDKCLLWSDSPPY